MFVSTKEVQRIAAQIMGRLDNVDDRMANLTRTVGKLCSDADIDAHTRGLLVQDVAYLRGAVKSLNSAIPAMASVMKPARAKKR